MNPNGNGELPPITPPKAPTAPIGASVPVGSLTPRNETKSSLDRERANQPPDEQAQAEEAQRAKKANEVAEDLEEKAGEPITGDSAEDTMEEFAKSGEGTGDTLEEGSTSSQEPPVRENPSEEPAVSTNSDGENNGASIVPVLTPTESTSVEPAQPTSQADQPRDVDVPVVPDGGSQDVGGDNGSTTSNETQDTPQSPETVPDAAFTGPPPVEPEDTAEATASAPKSPEPAPTDTETGNESEPQPAPVPGEPESQSTNPDVQPVKEKTVQEKVEEKVAQLPTALEEVIKGDPALQKEYEEMKAQAVDKEILSLMKEMAGNGEESLDLRIKRAESDVELDKDGNQIDKNGKPEKKEPQPELARVLRQRKDRIDEIQTQADRQAALNLLAKHNDNEALQSLLKIDGDPAEINKEIEKAKDRIDAKKSLASEELRAESKRAKNIEYGANKIDKLIKKKKLSEAKLRKEQMNIAEGLVRQEAFKKLTDDLGNPEKADEARKRINTLLELARDENNPLSKIALLKESDSPESLKEKVEQEGRYLESKKKQYGSWRKVGDIGKIARNADRAIEVEAKESEGIFEKKLDREMSKKELQTQLDSGKISPEKYAEEINKLAMQDKMLKEIEEKAEKQVNQKVRQYARKWGHSFKELIKNPKSKENWKEMALSTRDLTREGLKRLLMILGLWTIIQFILITAIEMRIAGKMFGQDGKG